MIIKAFLFPNVDKYQMDLKDSDSDSALKSTLDDINNPLNS